jgi:hypothetical protein
MLTKEEIEAFLDRLGVEGASHKELEPGLWLVKPGGALDFDVVVHYSPPVAVLRVKVMELPKDRGRLAELSRRLLELNATDLVHGSYGIEPNSNSVVLNETQELEHLDFSEFLGAYESITLALASHLREIGSYRNGAHGSTSAAPATKGRGGNSKKPKAATRTKAAKSAKSGKRARVRRGGRGGGR